MRLDFKAAYLGWHAILISKKSRPKGPGFGLPPGRGLSMTLLCSTYLWSVGVMEYWKNENPTPIFRNFKQRTSKISDA
jgi:hypothetical protein